MDGFHAALSQGRFVRPPTEYLDMIIIPATLHIDPLALLGYPPAMREALREWVLHWLGSGQGLNLDVVQRDG